MKKKHKYLFWSLAFVFFGLTLFLTFNRHSKSGYYNYHSEIWADKAGYYVYLPSAFIYNFNPVDFPDSIESKTGYGFKLDLQNKKVSTKYTYGVALLQLPFFLLAHFLAEHLNFSTTGFSPVYYWSINVASVFYLCFGLLILGGYLKNRFENNLVYLVVISLFLASNLFYYSIDETGMSHIYSFFLFSVYLFLLQKTNYLLKQDGLHLVLLGLVAGLIVLVRPTNILFLSSYFFLDLDGLKEINSRIKRLFQLKILLFAGTSLILVMIPQLIYWKYLSGSIFNYSYGDERFYWLQPKLIQTWFSPYNGLFLYSPFYLFIIASIIYLIKSKIKNSVFVLLLFVVLSYVLSCWWDRGFGCSFGGRSYIEYLALFSLPLTVIFIKVKESDTLKKTGFWILILALVAFNLKLTYTYDGCFYGGKNWDWGPYIELVLSPTK